MTLRRTRSTGTRTARPLGLRDLFFEHRQVFGVGVVDRAEDVDGTVSFNRQPFDRGVLDILNRLFPAGPEKSRAWHASL